MRYSREKAVFEYNFIIRQLSLHRSLEKGLGVVRFEYEQLVHSRLSAKNGIFVA